VTDTFAVFPGEWFKITFSQFMTDSGYHFGLDVDGRNVFDMIPNPNPFDFTGVTVHASLDKKVRQPVKMRNFVIEDAETTDSILEISDLVSESSDLTLQRSATNKDCIEDLPSDFDDTLETGKMLDMNPSLMSTLLTPRKSPKIEKSETAKEDKKEKDVSFEPFQESGMTILEPPEDDNGQENAEVFEDDRQTQNTSNEAGSDTSRTPHNSSSLPFEADPDMDKETRELIMSLLEEDEVRVPRPPPSRESRPSLPLETIAPVTSQRHLERRSAPDYSSYVPPREFSSTTVSGNHKEMRIGEVPETLSRETRHTRVRIRSRSPSPEHPMLTEQNKRDQQELVDQFIAMGFERRDISSAIFSCRGNAEKTLDMLINLRYHEF